MSESRGVSIPVPVLVGGVAALFVLGLGFAFLLGERSAATTTTTVNGLPTTTMTVIAPVAGAEDPARATTARPTAPVGEARLVAAGNEDALDNWLGRAPPSPDAPPAERAPDTAVAVVERAPPPPAPPTAPVVDEDPERAAVARYFEELELASTRHAQVEDPKSVGMDILKQTMQGSGNDMGRMLDDYKATRTSVASMRVPAPCKEHHRLTVAALDRGISLLERTQSAAAAKDLGAVGALGQLGRDLVDESRSVDAIADELKLKYRL